MEQDKEVIRKKLGADLFDDVYSFLIHHRSMDKTDEGQLFDDLKDMVQNDKRMLTEVFKLDGIVFREIVLENQNKFK